MGLCFASWYHGGVFCVMVGYYGGVLWLGKMGRVGWESITAEHHTKFDKTFRWDGVFV